MLATVIVSVETAFAREKKGREAAPMERGGFGFVYSFPVSEKFEKNAGEGMGGSFCMFVNEYTKFGHAYGVSTLEYVRYDLTEYRDSENYYQVYLSAYLFGKSIYGFHPMFGFVGIGYHNWKERLSPYVQMEGGLLFFPLTFYSTGIVYELFITREISIDISARYTFDLSFTRTSWQLALFTALF